MGGFLFGIRCFLRGFEIMGRPGVRPWALVPMVVSGALYGALFWFAGDRIEAVVEGALEHVPEVVAGLLGALIRVFLWLIAVWVFAVTFVVTASVVASPFNGPLAVAAQRSLTGRRPEGGQAGALRGLPRLLIQESKKLLYAALGSIPFLLLFVIPIVNLMAPVLWFFWTAWVTTLAYADYALDANGLLFRDMRTVLRRHKGAAFGFGGAAMFALTVPGLCVLAVPAAVCGGTVLWLEKLAPEAVERVRGHPAETRH